MKQYSLYDSATGLFTGRTFGTDLDASHPGHAQAVALNTPTGCAVIEGIHDHLSRKVDLTTGEVVDHVPPQPSPDHEFDSEARRWRLSEAAQAKRDAATVARARIAELEAASGPLVRKAVLGDPAARAKLVALEAEIQALSEHDS